MLKIHIANTNLTFCDGRRIKTIKLDEKSMLKNQYNPIPHPALDTKWERKRTIQGSKNSKSRKPRGDGHQAILNRMKRQTKSGRTLTIIINHNRSTALERSAKITGLVGVGDGFNRFYVEKNLRPKFCCGSKTYKVFGLREGLLIRLCIKTAII